MENIATPTDSLRMVRVTFDQMEILAQRIFSAFLSSVVRLVIGSPAHKW
jgi:hypothetical protein